MSELMSQSSPERTTDVRWSDRRLPCLSNQLVGGHRLEEPLGRSTVEEDGMAIDRAVSHSSACEDGMQEDAA